MVIIAKKQTEMPKVTRQMNKIVSDNIIETNDETHILARTITSSLSICEYTLQGRRTHMFVLLSGRCTIIANQEMQNIEAPCFIWMPSGLQRSIRLSAGSTGWMTSIPEMHLGPFIPHGTIGTGIRELVNQLAIVQDANTQELRRLGMLINHIEIELLEDKLAANTAVHYCISLLLIQFWRLHSHKINKGKPLPQNLVHNFIFLVDRHYRDHWNVEHYAKQIGVSKDRLTTAVRRATSSTPLELIHKKTISEAKALLTNSSMQIAEIAYQLGYRDAAYFNRFFSKQTGISPGRHRAKHQPKMLIDDSFAAWP